MAEGKNPGSILLGGLNRRGDLHGDSAISFVAFIFAL
jgi:hypothetical protein